MSLLPASVTLVVVMMLAAASARVAQDAGLSSALRLERQLARQRADFRLRRIAAKLAVEESESGDVSIEEVAVSEQAELGDLPQVLHRVTVIGQAFQGRIRLQADYALDGCESEDDDPCAPRVRRIAWRELPD